MAYLVKWPLIARDGTAVSPAPHESPLSAFKYADMVAVFLDAMDLDDAASCVWVEDANGQRVERPQHTTDS
jgi:hypothetical protein